MSQPHGKISSTNWRFCRPWFNCKKAVLTEFSNLQHRPTCMYCLYKTTRRSKTGHKIIYVSPLEILTQGNKFVNNNKKLRAGFFVFFKFISWTSPFNKAIPCCRKWMKIYAKWVAQKAVTQQLCIAWMPATLFRIILSSVNDAGLSCWCTFLL